MRPDSTMERRFYAVPHRYPVAMSHATGRSFPWAVLAIPVLVVGYVLAMGMTRSCPMCTAVVDAFRPGAAEPVALAAPAEDPALPERTAGEALGPMHGPVFVSLDGKPTAIADAAGKPMLIELWATWCGPCRVLRKTVHEVSRDYGDRVAFVAASVDRGGPGAVRIYAAENKAPAGSTVVDVMAGPAVVNAIDKINPRPSIPKVAFVDRDGRIVRVEVGILPDAAIRAALDGLLAPAD